MALGIIRLPCTERDKGGQKRDGVVELEFGCHVVSEAFSAIFQLCDCEQINHLDPWAFGFSSCQMDIIVTGSEVILFAHIFTSFPLTSNIYGYYGRWVLWVLWRLSIGGGGVFEGQGMLSLFIDHLTHSRLCPKCFWHINSQIPCNTSPSLIYRWEIWDKRLDDLFQVTELLNGRDRIWTWKSHS